MLLTKHHLKCDVDLDVNVYSCHLRPKTFFSIAGQDRLMIFINFLFQSLFSYCSACKMCGFVYMPLMFEYFKVHGCLYEKQKTSFQFCQPLFSSIEDVASKNRMGNQFFETPVQYVITKILKDLSNIVIKDLLT